MKEIGICTDEDLEKILDGKLTFIYSQCDCEGWKNYMPIIDEHQTLAQMKFYATEYPAEGVFKFCPWCGKQRHTL